VTETPSADTVPAKKAASKSAPKSAGLSSMLLADLKSMAAGLGVAGAGSMKKAQLVDAIKATQSGAPAKASVGAPASGARSTVPASLTRVESAAEDAIDFLERGRSAKARQALEALRRLAHGQAATDLAKAGVARAKVRALQRRADRAASLSARGAAELEVSLAANAVSQLMPGLYASYRDPVPPTVLKLDYLDRELQLRSRAGQPSAVSARVRDLTATWTKLRPAVVRAGGRKVALDYDGHVRALRTDTAPAAVQRQAAIGLELVDRLEDVFRGR